LYSDTLFFFKQRGFEMSAIWDVAAGAAFLTAAFLCDLYWVSEYHAVLSVASLCSIGT